MKQYVDRLSGEHACRQAAERMLARTHCNVKSNGCPSGVSAVAVDAFMNYAG